MHPIRPQHAAPAFHSLVRSRVGAVCLACLVLIALLLVGCETFKPKEAAPKRETTPLATAGKKSDEATAKADAAVVNAEHKDETRDAKVLANVNAAREANQSNPDGAPKQNTDMELEIAQSRLADVSPDSAEAAAAAQRREAFAAGQAEEARKSADQSKAEASAAIAEIAKARAEAAQAIKERDAARKAEREALATLERKLEENRRANEAALQKVRDEERNKMIRLITYGLLAIAGLAVLTGAFLVYSKIQTGDIPKAIIVGVVFGGAAAFAAACAWTINQWWFKWVMIGGGTLGVIAFVFYIQTELRDAREKRQRLGEADEAEDTLNRVMSALDSLPDGHELFSKLSNGMNDEHKALVHELRAESKRRKAKKLSQ